MLPDRKPLLRQVDQRLAGGEGLSPMRGRDSRHEGGLADRDRSHPMGHDEGEELEAGVDVLGDLPEHGLSRRVALIRERRDRATVIVVAHGATEGDDGAGAGIIDQRLQRGEVEHTLGHLDQTDLTHRAIIVRRPGIGPGNGVVMREVLPELMAVRNRHGSAAMATVVRTWRSAPRPPGASMLVTDEAEAVGSVCGGCVEGALFDLGQEVLADGQPRFETYGVSDDDAFAVGLMCGGILEVFVERVDEKTWPELEGIAESIAAEEPVAVATIVSGPHHVGRHLVVRKDRTEGSLGTPRLDDTVREDAIGMLESGTTGFLRYGPDGERLGEGLDVFVQSFAPKPRMIVFGAIDFSAALVRVGKLLGFKVSVVDARPVFATAKRFPDADEVIVDWPHRWLSGQEVDSRTVIAVLTHDPKFDVPAIKEALKTNAGYIGAMGSRRTHEDRVIRLKEAGVTDDELARVHSPIGLDLGARTPEETAISIAAEIIQSRWGGSGAHLATTQGPIHPGAPR